MSEYREFDVKVHYEKDHIWAEVVNLPGCFVTGRTIDELREALAEAIGMYLSNRPGECRVELLNFSPPAAVQHVPVRAELVPA
ncbi:MAG TPA: type II toxin-antitoxin system HicB family antitoxin [Trueperaceae bacterium]